MTSSDDRLTQLIERYLDGQISAGEKRELATELRGQPEARHRLLQHANWHAALVHWGAQRAGEQQSKRDVLRGFFRPATRGGAPRRGWQHGRSSSLAAAASAAILLAGLFATALQHKDPLRSVAKVTFDRQTEWAIARRPDNRGNLRPGDYELFAGLLRFETDARAVVTIAAPAKFRIVDGENIRLDQGKLLARMLGEGSRLTVCTRAMSVVDLGTVFGVKADAAGGDVVSVFDGKVAVRDLRTDRTPHLLTAGSSLLAEQAAGPRVTPETFDRMNFFDLWPLTVGVNDFSNVVQILPPGPQIDPWRDYRSGLTVFLLPERQGITPDAALRVDLAGAVVAKKTSGGFDLLHPAPLNSYLLFFNPPLDADSRPFSISGHVTFAAPIAGVITSEANLAASGASFGRAHLTEPPPAAVSDDAGRDLVRISEDGRSLYFQLHVGANRKHLRVLVNAQ